MRKKIFILVILYVFLFSNLGAYAATPEEVGLYVASYAKNFCESYTINYGSSGGGFGTFNGNNFTSECVSFCRRMYKDSVGYGADRWIPVPAGNSGTYNSPADTQAGKRANDFELITFDDLSLAIPGDIIENYHHDMIYIGTIGENDDILANNGRNNNSCGLANGLMSMSKDYVHSNGTFSAHGKMSSGASGCHFRVWRITEEAAAALGDVSSFDSGGQLMDPVVSKRYTTASATNLKMSNFYYNGIADGKYSVTKSVWEVLVESLSDVFDYLIGFCTMLVRMVFVGWTAIIEVIINSTLKAITGSEDLNKIPITSTQVESSDNISLEKIIFNEIGIFDVNFFNFNGVEGSDD